MTGSKSIDRLPDFELGRLVSDRKRHRDGVGKGPNSFRKHDLIAEAAKASVAVLHQRFWRGRGVENAMVIGEPHGPRCTCSICKSRVDHCRVFGGSGRTALAADDLGRDRTLIELNPQSVRMAHAQIERAKASRFIGNVTDKVPVPDGHGAFMFDAGDAA